jgi:hypothetical protein
MKNKESAVVAEFYLRDDGRYELFSVYTLEDGCMGTEGYDVDWCESTQEYGERYAKHILCRENWRVILESWDSTRKKIWHGGVVLYRSR